MALNFRIVWLMFWYLYMIDNVIQHLPLKCGEYWKLFSSIPRWYLYISSGRGDVSDSEAVAKAQWQIARCFLWKLSKNRGVNANLIFARTMSAMCQVRELCEDFYQWIETNPFENYNQVKENGFMAEWFAPTDKPWISCNFNETRCVKFCQLINIDRLLVFFSSLLF